MEKITDADYMHGKIVCKNFESFGEYHDLYFKIDPLYFSSNCTLILDFENVRKICLNIYHSDPAKLLSASGWVWLTALKKTEVKLELLTDIDMLLMIEKGIREGIFNAVHRYAKANNKYMKVYDNN